MPFTLSVNLPEKLVSVLLQYIFPVVPVLGNMLTLRSLPLSSMMLDEHTLIEPTQIFKHSWTPEPRVSVKKGHLLCQSSFHQSKIDKSCNFRKAFSDYQKSGIAPCMESIHLRCGCLSNPQPERLRRSRE